METDNQNVPQLSHAEWKRLPRAEKDRLRAIKHERRRRERGQSPNHRKNGVARKSPTSAIPPTPFVLPSNLQPVDLSFIGNGGACFIVLAGPSLKLIDLSKLARRGAYTIAVNNAGTIVRPNAWTHVDPASKFHNAIWLDPHVLKFCPSRLLRRHIRQKTADGDFQKVNFEGREMTPADCPSTVGYKRQPTFNADSFLSEPVVNWGVSKKYQRQEKKHGRHRDRILNVMFAVLKIAYCLNFRHVFLLGCDFGMREAAPYAFDQGKTNGAVASNNNAYQIMQGMFSELQPIFLDAGFHVYNCNRESNLTAFPFVGYDDAIESATGFIPQDPLDTKDWYQK